MSVFIDAIVYFSVVLMMMIYFPVELFLVFICYSIKYSKKETNKKYTCSICLEDINTKNNFSITQCNHHFHTKCITTWLRNNDNCPICRFKLIETIDDDQDTNYIDYSNYIDPLDRMLDQDII